MLQHYTTTKVAGTATDSANGDKSWSDVDDARVEDGDLASCGAVGPGGGGGSPSQLYLTDFDFNLPAAAVIDGIFVEAKVQTTGGATGNDSGYVSLLYDGGETDTDDTPGGGIAWSSTLNWITHGDIESLWGREWTPTEVNDSDFGVALAALPGTGTATINIDAVQISVHWHIELTNTPTDVPTRVAYKVYSRDGNYLGELPNVTTPFAFSQDINTAGSSIEIGCAVLPKNETTVDTLLTEGGAEITTEAGDPILVTSVDEIFALGGSNDEAIFKNSNRIEVIIYNYWYPNGKTMFSGQVNKVSLHFGSDYSGVNMLLVSDGADLVNYIARGYPFSYTTDVSQTSQNGYVTVTEDGGKSAGWHRYGQSWLTGGAVDNVGALTLKLRGTATVTLAIYDAPNGTFLGSSTKSVSAGSATDVQFEFPAPIELDSSTTYFMAVSVAEGQSIKVYYHSTSSTYSDGTMYESNYSGGSGGGSYTSVAGDFYFITKSGEATTTTTYSSDDPVTDMMTNILLDYNARGGYITERDFTATGLSITYTFNQMTIFDALLKILELSQTGYYTFIDLGTAEIDILQQSQSADFTLVRAKDLTQVDINLSIEQVKNYLLVNGGDTGGGTNLYRQYQDTESVAFYGIRTASKSDNRVTLSATADAIGDTFVEQNAGETQETTVTVLNTDIDITLLTPGKTVGFRNFDTFIDNMVLQIVRREYNVDSVTLTLGRLPVRMNDEVQKINRAILNEQTIDNPDTPS